MADDDNVSFLSSKSTSAHPEDRTRPRSSLRWLLLALGVAVISGPYYAFDPSGALLELRGAFGVSPFLNANSTAAQNASFVAFNSDYQGLYSAYSFPNLVLPFFAGALVDSFGVRPMVVLTSTIAFAGQAVVSFGVQIKNWPVMFAGRALFGIGTESMVVALRSFLSIWFIGKELAFSNACQLALGRLAGVASIRLSALFSPETVWLAFATGAAICAFSVLCAALAAFLDRRWEKATERLSRETKQRRSSSSSATAKGLGSFSSFLSAPTAATAEDAHVSSSLEPLPAVLREHSLTEIPRRKVTLPLPLEALTLPSALPAGKGADDDIAAAVDAALNAQESASQQHQPFLMKEEVKQGLLSSLPEDEPKRRCLSACCPDFSLVRTFKAEYWLLLILSIVGFSPVTTFNGVIPALLKQRWESAGQTPTVAEINSVASIVYAVAAGTAPFMGWLLGKVNFNSAFLLAAQLAIAGAHAALAFSESTSEAASLAVLGLAFGTFASAFWTAISSFVPLTSQGLAFGLMGAVQNAGLATAPFLVAALQPPAACDDKYTCLEVAFTGVAALGALISLVLVLMELRTKRRLADKKSKKNKQVSQPHAIEDWAPSKAAVVANNKESNLSNGAN